MNKQVLIKRRITSAEDMRALGRAFGSYFLLPILDTSSAGSTDLVVCLYGDSGVGKSEFGEAAIESFDVFHRNVRQVGRMGLLKVCWAVAPISDKPCLFRWKDFGQYSGVTYAPTSEPYINDCQPRTLISATSIQGGLDILEHAPIAHAENAHIIILFGKRDDTNKDHSFGNPFPSDAIESATTLYRPWQIAAEMRKMNLLQHDSLSMFDQLRSEFSSFSEATPPSRDDRYVTIMLTTENRDLKQKYGYLKGKLPQYQC